MPPPTTPEEFWAKGTRSGRCLLWTGFADPRGYGRVSYHGRRWRAPRLAWTLTYGVIPAGKTVLHHCDTPACYEPTCLFLGSQADNIGEMPRPLTAGAHNGRAKLTEQQVQDIRRRSQNEIGLRLSKEYGVSPATISEIKNRRHWQSVA